MSNTGVFAHLLRQLFACKVVSSCCTLSYTDLSEAKSFTNCSDKLKAKITFEMHRNRKARIVLAESEYN